MTSIVMYWHWIPTFRLICEKTPLWKGQISINNSQLWISHITCNKQFIDCRRLYAVTAKTITGLVRWSQCFFYRDSQARSCNYRLNVHHHLSLFAASPCGVLSVLLQQPVIMQHVLRPFMMTTGNVPEGSDISHQNSEWGTTGWAKKNGAR